MRADVAEDHSTVFIRGTKRSTRLRMVPIVGDTGRSLLEYALTYAQGEGGVPFRPWINIRRDLHVACDAVKIARCSPNDLRRTCATWLRAAGASPELIAPVMGHADTRMVERVYGRLPLEDLRRRLALAIGETAAPVQQTTRTEPDPAHSADGADSDAPGHADAENLRAHQTLPSDGPDVRAQLSVPGGGIEPPTRGFSVPCSTI